MEEDTLQKTSFGLDRIPEPWVWRQKPPATHMRAGWSALSSLLLLSYFHTEHYRLTRARLQKPASLPRGQTHAKRVRSLITPFGVAVSVSAPPAAGHPLPSGKLIQAAGEAKRVESWQCYSPYLCTTAQSSCLPTQQEGHLRGNNTPTGDQEWKLF